MRRFLTERRAWAVAVCIAFALVIGLWVWGARRATVYASERIGDRFGVEADVAEAHIAFGGIELHDVEMRGRSGGFVIRADRMKARITPFGVMFGGMSSVHGISAHHIDATFDLGHEGIGDSLAELKRSVAPRPLEVSSAPRSSRKGRTYEVTGLTVRVRDADGSLVLLKEVSLDKESDDLRCTVSETLVGEEQGDHARIGPSTLALRREEGVWLLRELIVEGGNVRWLGDESAEKNPLALRIREALDAFRAPVTQPDNDEEDTELRPPGSADHTRLLARVTHDAHVDVSSLQIESRTPEGRVERIQDLKFALSGRDDGWYQLSVRGQTSNDGTMNVDLRLMPREVRAEGSVIFRGISLALVAPFVPEIPLYDAEIGTVSGQLQLLADSPHQVRIEGGMKLIELGLASERIAPEPIEHINVSAGGQGVWFPAERRLQIDQGHVQLGKTRVLIDGELERTSEHYRADLTAKLPPTKCNEVVGAIPSDVLGALKGFSWSGNWSAIAQITLDSRDLEATELTIRARNLCEFEQIPKWVRVERFQEPFRHRVVEPDESTFEMRTGPGTDNWVPLADVSPFLIQAVISHEDARFYDHAGFAPWAIRDALVRNLQEGHYAVGASTISMQLAKNLYLQREKTVARKVQEVLLTWWLENALNKDQILELYLNVIEYGPSIYGLGNAAAHYFGRHPGELSPAESAFLACVLPSPKRYHIYYERNALMRTMQNKMRRLLEHMAKRERIGPEALAYGLAELEDFRFYHEGDPIPEPRVLPPLGVPEEPEELDPFEALFIAP